MSALFDPQQFSKRVSDACREAASPGVTFAVIHNGRMMSAAAGVVNVETGVEARPNSLFQIGSITKSLTATLIMQAAEEGLIDIDTPITKIISEPVGRGEFRGTFTPRQLMSHMSGLDGDMFTDTGRDDDAIAKYIVLCADLEFMCPPGRYYNYCNSGYAVLGRMLEIVRKKTYDQVLKDHLFAPLGLTRSTTFAEEAAYARTAVGHITGADGKPALAPFVQLPRALGPAGLSLYSTAEDLVAYANAHMGGDKVLSLAGQAAMRTPHAELPEDASWGLGWKLITRGDVQFVGHEGGTVGQMASLALVPQARLAVAMCANGGDSGIAWKQIAHPFFQDVCGAIPEYDIPDYPKEPVDLSPFEGVFENLGVRVTITAEAGALKGVVKHKTYTQPDTVFTMRAIGNDRFRASIHGDDRIVMAFHDRRKDGKPALFYAGRLHRRVEG
jgi:CubicO group peptidase (beta-lactamase class C family)